jgi:branched-chain amino acid transport system permease protein
MTTNTNRFYYARIILPWALVLVLPLLLNLSSYVFHTINMIAYFTIAVAGLNILMGYTGQISIGHAVFYAIGAYTSAILARKLALPFWMLIPLAGFAAALMGFFMGACCLRLKEIYLAMATIGLAGAGEGIIINWDTLTGGSMGLLGIPYFSIGSFVLDTPQRQYFLVIPIMLLMLFVARQIVTSRVGRAFMAIREDPVAATCYGIDTTGYKLIAFTLSAFYCGVAGSLFAHSTGIVFPDNFGMEVSIVLLMMLVIGGRGTITGSIVGAALLTAGFELLRGIKDYQMIVYGMVLVAFILFIPQGIVGALVAQARKHLPALCGVKDSCAATVQNGKG